MSRTLLVAAALLLTAPSAFAQDFRDELRFAEALRSRGDVDLALELLNKLAKTATEEQKKELPLEMAKTRLRLAADEPDTTKRLAVYRQSREELQNFITGNPGHLRVAEANLDIARVLDAQGKTELSQALLKEDRKDKLAMAAQARGTLAEAYKRLEAAEKELQAIHDKLPNPEDIAELDRKRAAAQARTRAEREVKQTTFERAMNLYDQSNTYLAGIDDAKASELLQQAEKLLAPLASGPPASPITWKAIAWQGRIQFQIETADKAYSKFAEVFAGERKYPNAAAEGARLATYFYLQVVRDKPKDELRKRPNGPNLEIIREGEAWLRKYRRYTKTPEGAGLMFLLARTYLEDAATNKALGEVARSDRRTRARALLSQLEHSENEFTDQARRLKIQTMAAQGLFKRKVESLKTFEDLFVRAQYEAFQLGQDPTADIQDRLKKLDPDKITNAAEKKAALAERKKLEAQLEALKEPGALEKKRKEQVDLIKDALKRALELPEVKKMKASAELDNARAMYTYWAMETKDFEEAIRVGEDFIRNDPRSSQAAMTALYVIQAYAQLLDQKRAKFEENEVASLRSRLFALASYAEERWPTAGPGEMARHTVGVQLLKEENYSEAIKKLSLISPSYGNYVLVCYQLADMCMKAEKANAEPIPGDRDVKDYTKRAILALERIPITALGPDPMTNHLAVNGKVILCRQLFRYKRYQQMEAMTAQLIPMLGKLKFNADDKADGDIRTQLRVDLTDLGLFAKYGMAAEAQANGDHAKAAALLDPLVDLLSKKEESQEKQNLQKNTQLAGGILTIALRSNLQLGKIDRTDLVLESLEQVTAGDEMGGGSTTILQLLAFLIKGQVEEMRKKGDKAALDTTIKGYTAILTKRTAKLKPTPDLIRALAACYSSMGEHDKAAKELNGLKIDEKDPLFKGVRLMYVRELRLSKKPDNLKEARKLMDEIIGDPAAKKPGWGARDISALKENGLLMHEEGEWAKAFQLWSGLVKALAPRVAAGGPTREAYFEVYFYMVLSFHKHGMTRVTAEDRKKALDGTVRQIHTFETNWPDYGGDASKARFMELLAQEPDVKAAVEAMRRK